MIKRIAADLIRWLILLLLFLTIMFWNDSRIAMAAVVAFLLLPPVTFLSNLWIKKYVEAAIGTQLSVSKGEALAGTVTVINKGILPLWKVCCQVDVKNQLTGENITQYLPSRCPGRGSATVDFVIESKHCGYLNLTVSRVWLLDWFGFLPVWIRQKVQTQVSVLPDTFAPHVFLKLAMTQREDADSWSQVRKGADLTEIFALRDYVAGDSLKQIHWKMTAKRGQVIVREASLPVERSLLLYWNKNLGTLNPMEMDAMAECVASVAQEILNQGTVFVLGWTEGKNRILEEIDTEERLFQAIPRMLKYGADPQAGELEFQDQNMYSKVIYFAGSIPERESMPPCEEIRFLVCGETTAVEEGVIHFRGEHYLEDLEHIEI